MLAEPTLVHDALFGGRGRVKVWDLMGATRVGPFVAVLACELEPLGLVGAHVQEGFAEIVIGSSGLGRAQVDGVAYELRPGAVVALPLGSVLSIENQSDSEPLAYLIVKAKA